MEAKHTPALPPTLTYDNSTGAHGVGCVLFPDGFALDTAGGPGGDPRGMPAYREAVMREIVRRWNALPNALATLREITLTTTDRDVYAIARTTLASIPTPAPTATK